MDYSVSARRGRALLGFAGAITIALGISAPAHAAGDSTSCRASAARVTLANQNLVEPVRANAHGTPCSTQSAETLHPTTIGPVSVDAAEAYTSSAPRAEAALAGVSDPTVDGGHGVALVEAGTIHASVEAACTGDTPKLTSDGEVEGLRVAGVPVDVTPDQSEQRLDLPGGGALVLNQTTRKGGTITRRAIVVSIPGAADVVLGEARASIDHATCVNGTGVGDDGTGGTVANVCPDGSTLDTSRAVCVIHEHGSNGPKGSDGSSRTITVGKPYAGPSGGRVVALDRARTNPRLKTSPCVKGKGPAYVVTGAGGANRVTGTNHGDRIIVLGAHDRVDGGRGRDCLDGGTAADKLAGGLGNDRLYGGGGNDHLLGGSGNDRLTGGPGRDLITGDTGSDRIASGAGNDRVLAGPGNDRLSGGRGNDVLSAGYGRDRVAGGPGRDLLLVNVFGPAARRIDGGSGRDTARFNPKERRKVRHVEHKELIA